MPNKPDTKQNKDEDENKSPKTNWNCKDAKRTPQLLVWVTGLPVWEPPEVEQVCGWGV